MTVLTKVKLPSRRAETQDLAAELGVPHERVALRRGERSGLTTIIGVHSTRLGPALGGARMWAYDTDRDAVRDALRLSGAMTLKAAAAGLDLGGGKGVIALPQDRPVSPSLRRDALLDFADLVEELDGAYVTAEDVGTNALDMAVIRERTRHVTGLPVSHGGSGDPSPFTALGVEAAMRACATARFGSPDLAGLRVVIVGFGHVGERLAGRLVGAGAKVVTTDVDDSRHEAATAIGAEWVRPELAMSLPCDVLAPCALGGSIDATTAGLLQCEIVCGCANNQLADDALADVLADAGVLYAPDFVANAGGLIHVYRELRGYSAREAVELVLGIENALAQILGDATDQRITPLQAARLVADRRLQPAQAA